jgi:hypothetical protein
MEKRKGRILRQGVRNKEGKGGRKRHMEGKRNERGLTWKMFKEGTYEEYNGFCIK